MSLNFSLDQSLMLFTDDDDDDEEDEEESSEDEHNETQERHMFDLARNQV